MTEEQLYAAIGAFDDEWKHGDHVEGERMEPCMRKALEAYEQAREVPAMPTRDSVIESLKRLANYDDGVMPTCAAIPSWYFAVTADYVLSLLTQRQQPPQAVWTIDRKAELANAMMHEFSEERAPWASIAEFVAKHVGSVCPSVPKLLDLQDAHAAIDKLTAERDTALRDLAEAREQLAAKEAELNARREAYDMFGEAASTRIANLELALTDTKARLAALREVCTDIVENSGWAQSKMIHHAPSYVQFLARALAEAVEPDRFETCRERGTYALTGADPEGDDAFFARRNVAPAPQPVELADTKARLRKLMEIADQQRERNRRLVARDSGFAFVWEDRQKDLDALLAPLTETAEPAPQPDLRSKVERVLKRIEERRSESAEQWHACPRHSFDNGIGRGRENAFEEAADLLNNALTGEPLDELHEYPAPPDWDPFGDDSQIPADVIRDRETERGLAPKPVEPAKPQVTLEALTARVDHLSRQVMLAESRGDRHERALAAVARELDAEEWYLVDGHDVLAALDTDHAEAGKGDM